MDIWVVLLDGSPEFASQHYHEAFDRYAQLKCWGYRVELRKV